MLTLLIQVTFANFLLTGVMMGAEGFVEMCNETKPEAPVAGMFQFKIEGTDALFESPVGACTPATSVNSGRLVVQAVAQSGTVVVEVQTLPKGRLIDCDIATGTATITVPAGDVSTQTVVIFTRIATYESSTNLIQQPRKSEQAGPVESWDVSRSFPLAAGPGWRAQSWYYWSKLTVCCEPKEARRNGV